MERYTMPRFGTAPDLLFHRRHSPPALEYRELLRPNPLTPPSHRMTRMIRVTRKLD